MFKENLYEHQAFRTFPDLFAEQLTETPNNIAIAWGQGSLSYTDLDRKSIYVANYLDQKDFKEDTVIAVALPNTTPDLFIAMLAIMRIGLAVCIIDESLPLEEKQDFIDHSGAVLLISNSHQGQLEIETIDINEILQTDALDKEFILPKPIFENTLAYIAFTSGTSGTPKAVAIEHAGLVSRFEAHKEALELTQGDVVYQASLVRFFDPLLMEFMMALGCGAKLQLMPESNKAGLHKLAEHCNETGATVIILIPSVLQKLDPNSFKKLRCIISTGEASSQPLLELWKEHVRIFNGYGPLETTIGSTLTEYTGGEVSIGSDPFPGTRMYLYNSETQKLSTTTGKGVLYIGGIGLARCYYKNGSPDHELTEERFLWLPDPEDPEKEMRFYNTGDEVEIIESNYYYLGREDDQVQIAGVRVEPEGVARSILNRLNQNTLNQKSFELTDVYVIPYTNKSEDTRLTAILVPSDKTPEFHLEAILSYITDNPNDFNAKVPSSFYLTSREQIPRTTSGKLDKKELLQQIQAGRCERIMKEKINGPRYPLEVQIHDIWSDCLELNECDIHSTFAELGGYSLLWMTLQNKLQDEVDMDMNGILMNENISIAELSRQILLMHLYKQCFVTLHKGNSPLFLLHPVDGSIGRFTKLAKQIDDSIPMVAIRDILFDEGRINEDLMKAGIVTDIKEKAYYLAVEISQRSLGKIRLAGWSYGGLLAYEIAHVCQARGADVVYLGLIDSQAPEKSLSLSLDEHWQRLQFIINRIIKAHGKKIIIDESDIENVEWINLTKEEQVNTLFSYYIENIKKQNSSDETIKLCNGLETAKANFLATLGYHPKNQLSAATHLYVAGGQLDTDGAEVESTDWQKFLAPGVLQCEHFDHYDHFELVTAPEIATALAYAAKTFSNNMATLTTWKLPKIEEHYFNRKSYIKELDTLFSENCWQSRKTVSLYGMPGVGKSSLAAFYVEQKTNYRFRFWINAEIEEQLKTELIELAVALGVVDSEHMHKDGIRNLHLWMRSTANWLLVLDNVESIYMAEGLLPSDFKGHILITTRLETTSNSLEIREFDLLEAQQFIAAQLWENLSDIELLAIKLGNLPLALDNVVSYIKQTGISISDYLKNYKNDEGRVSIYPTLTMTLRILEYTSPITRNFLLAIALLYPVRIPKELLVDVFFREVSDSSLVINGPLGLLRNYSLIRIDSHEYTVSMHRLIQETLLSLYSAEVISELKIQLVSSVTTLLEVEDWNEQVWQLSSKLILHAEKLFSTMENTGTDDLPRLRLILAMANYYEKTDSRDRQAFYLSAAEDIFNNLLGNFPPEELMVYYCKYIDSSTSMAIGLRTGFTDVIDKAERFLEEYHSSLDEPLQIELRINLGLMYGERAEYDGKKGKNIDEDNDLSKAINLLETALKSNYIFTDNKKMRLIINIANLYRKKGDFEKSEEFFLRGERFFNAHTGVSEEYLAYCEGSLGTIYHDDNNPSKNLDEAERYLKLNLEHSKQLMRTKSNKRQLAWSYYGLSFIAVKRGDFKTSDRHYQTFKYYLNSHYQDREHWPESYNDFAVRLEEAIQELGNKDFPKKKNYSQFFSSSSDEIQDLNTDSHKITYQQIQGESGNNFRS